MEKKISLFLAILTLGFAQQIFAQDENASADDSERWSDFLPLNKELAGDADLPLPFGIGITGYWQEQDMKASKNIGFGLDATALGQSCRCNQRHSNFHPMWQSELDNYNIRSGCMGSAVS